MNRKQRAIVTDENYLSLQGLCTIVKQHTSLTLVSSNDCLAELRTDIEKHTPDILVLNINQTKESLINLLKKLDAGIKLLMIADIASTQWIKTIWKLNPHGIITNNCSEEEIVEALDRLTENKNFYCNRILDCIHNNDDSSITEKHGLSTRELEVIQLITKGRSTSDIADKLFVSKHTINSHRKNILKKLGLKSPVELIVFAIENNLR